MVELETGFKERDNLAWMIEERRSNKEDGRRKKKEQRKRRTIKKEDVEEKNIKSSIGREITVN